MLQTTSKIKKVFLIPNELSEGTAERYMPDVVKDTLLGLRIIFCEDARTTRRYIGKLLRGKVSVEDYVLFELTKLAFLILKGLIIYSFGREVLQ